MNSKSQIAYDKVFKEIINILLISSDNKLKEFDTITTDKELALINSINNNFKYKQRISCYYKLKQNLINKAKDIGLTKLILLGEAEGLIHKIGCIPLYYKKDMNKFEEVIKILSSEYPRHLNLISYFNESFKNFFADGSYNYADFPIYTRSNSKIENYNGYIKNKLNNQKEINFLNFYNFL